MITVQKDDICMEIDERVLSEHERLGWHKVDELPENDTVPLADYQALQAELDVAKQRITELEATQTKSKPTKSDKSAE